MKGLGKHNERAVGGRQTSVLRRGNDVNQQLCKAGNGLLVGQQGGEFTPAVTTTRTRDAPLQADATFAEIRLGSCVRPLPLQSGARSLPHRSFQAQPNRSSYRVAPALFKTGSGIWRQTEKDSNSSGRNLPRDQTRRRAALWARTVIPSQSPALTRSAGATQLPPAHSTFGNAR
jgi:hypothetical protein